MRIGKTGIYSPQRKISLVKRVTLGYQITPWERGETIWLCPGRPWWLSRGAPALQRKPGEPPSLGPGAGACAQGLLRQGRKGRSRSWGSPLLPTNLGPRSHRGCPAGPCPAALTAPRQGRVQPFQGVGSSSAGQGKAIAPGRRTGLASRSGLGGPRGGLPLCSRAP